MSRIHRGFAAALGAMLPLGSASAGVYDDLWRGLQILSLPSGSPITGAAGGGASNGQRFGRVRIVPNLPGDGFDLEFDRTFGIDSRGRPEVLDLGNFEIELSGATQATAGFTRNGIPTANAQMLANNLTYSIRGKTGAQDVEWRGTMNVANNFEINALGFYSLDATVVNTNSDVVLDGLLVEGTDDPDFNVGPIRVEGNLFYDGFIAIVSGFGLDTSELEAVFPASPIDRVADEIQRQLETQVLGEQFTADSFAQDVDRVASQISPSTSSAGPLPIPEPGAVLLLGVGGLLLLRRR